MENNPQLGLSICAVVLLILGSLSNVVGYQSVTSPVNDSPLFISRTQRAINQQQNNITSQYLGKGKDSIPFSIRDNTTSLMQQLINQIRGLDNNEYNKFIKHTICLLISQGAMKYSESKDIENWFHTLRKKLGVSDDSANLDLGNYTWRVTPTICWFPGCFLLFIGVVFLLTLGFHCFPTQKICLNAFPQL